MDPLKSASLEEDLNDPPSKYINSVKLISQEGHEFIVDRQTVMASGTIRSMLLGPGVWKQDNNEMPTLVLESIPTEVLEKVIQYFYYKFKWDHTKPPLPEFNIDIQSVVPLLLAASFLDT